MELLVFKRDLIKNCFISTGSRWGNEREKHTPLQGVQYRLYYRAWFFHECVSFSFSSGCSCCTSISLGMMQCGSADGHTERQVVIGFLFSLSESLTFRMCAMNGCRADRGVEHANWKAALWCLNQHSVRTSKSCGRWHTALLCVSVYLSKLKLRSEIQDRENNGL